MALQKKISNSSEAAIILEGGLGFVEKPVSVFVRLAKPIVLGDLPEVDIPTRFIYFFIGPAQVMASNHPRTKNAIDLTVRFNSKSKNE